MRIIFSQQLGNNINEAFKLEPIREVHKEDDGSLLYLIKDVVMCFLESEGGYHKVSPEDKGWICKDDEGNWRYYTDKEYNDYVVSNNYNVIRPLNKKTYAQYMAIKIMDKMKQDFEELSYEEKLELHRLHPDLVVTVED